MLQDSARKLDKQLRSVFRSLEPRNSLDFTKINNHSRLRAANEVEKSIEFAINPLLGERVAE